MEEIRLYVICRAMDWNHLPQQGGIYDQSPRLLDRWMHIWQLEAVKQEKEAAERDHKLQAQGRSGAKGR